MPHRLAVISDIHSNFQALQAVLKDITLLGISEIVCLGDIVGYASGVRSCLRSIRQLGCPVVLGNHDEAACQSEPPEDMNDAAAAGIVYAGKRLYEKDRSWINALPATVEVHGILFTHASLADPMGWPYINSLEDARLHFAGQISRLAFCGHTHKPMIWWQETPSGRIAQRAGTGTILLPSKGGMLINAGSTGQPRDGDPRACYAIHNTEENSVEFRRVPYDIVRTKRGILRAGLPRFTAQRLSLGR